jgi:superoxide dismutase, Cu-Zn family
LLQRGSEEIEMKMKSLYVACAAAVLLGSCESAPRAEELRANAHLQPTKGNKAFGEATFEQVGDKVRVIVFAQGLRPGQGHGFHIHEVGDCSAPDAESAKGHFDPLKKPHGDPKSPERHAGDLPMLVANKEGRARLEVDMDIITLRPGPANIIGRSLIIHADPDDFKTQPTGNSGARIACGVIREG